MNEMMLESNVAKYVIRRLSANIKWYIGTMKFSRQEMTP